MLVSVIIPTHNRAAIVIKAIESVLNQSHKNLELIVVDDGSTDQTPDRMKEITDVRFRYCHRPHAGVAAARNYGVCKAKGEWLCFLDSDDVWHKNKLEEQILFHQNNPELVFSQTDDIWFRNGVRVNKKKKHMVREGGIFKESLKLCLVCCSSVTIKKDIFWLVGGFDEKLPTCEDYDLWLKLLMKYPVGFVPQMLVTKQGGYEDQLSKKFPIMDQYRIQSLENLLTNEGLNAEQQRWVEEELMVKKEIMKKGREKRMQNER